MLPRLPPSSQQLIRAVVDSFRQRKSAAITLLVATAILPTCIIALLKSGEARVWLGPLAGAILTATILGLAWEFHWKSSVAEEVFNRFHPPAVGTGVRFLSPLTLFTYAEAKKICQVGPDAIQLSLICAENHRIRMTQIEFSADGDFFEFVAEIRKSHELVESAEKVRVAFDKIAGQLKLLGSGEGVSPIVEALKGVPDFLDKLSGLMANAIVPLAHYLSNRDQMKTLREINKKLDDLFKFREIDQEAELKSIYLHAAQELSAETSIISSERFDPHKRGLIKLRNVWADEILDRLRKSPNVTDAVFRKRKERRYCQHVLPIAVKLQLFQLAFFTDLCLAQATGSINEFVAIVVRDDIGKFQEISDSLTRLQALLITKDQDKQPYYPHALAIQQGAVSLLGFLKSIEPPSQNGKEVRTIQTR